VVVGLFITPVLIRSLDSSLFGVWKILQQLVDYMAAADGRPTQAVKWVIANQQHADGPTKRRTVTCAFATWLIYAPLVLLVGGILFALGSALVLPSSMALAIDRANPRRRGTAMASYSMWFQIGNGLGAAMAGLAADLYGLRAMYLFALAPPLAGLFISFRADRH
jgi:MFS family permease